MQLTLLAEATIITDEFGVNWKLFVFQLINTLVFLGLFLGLLILAIRKILEGAKGVEVPIWIGLCLIFPIIMPIVALFYFKKKA